MLLIKSNQYKEYLIIQIIMEGDLSPEHFELVLKLCDILSIEDFSVAALILKQSNWNIQKAIGIEDASASSYPKFQPNPSPQPKPQTLPHKVSTAGQIKSEQPQQNQFIQRTQTAQQPISGKNQNQNIYELDANIDNEYEQEPMEYEYSALDDYYQQQEQQQYYRKQQLARNQFQTKKRTFNLGFISMPLTKTKSQVMDKSEKSLILDKEISQNYSKHRFQYQNNLLQKSSLLCQRILCSKSPEMRRVYESLKKNQSNKQFLSYLHKKYASKINFTFGTFLLNLARSYLDNKHLLVYIHKSQFQDSKSVKMLLSHGLIAKFVNKHCVCYGMFDSSDDYETLHNYVPMRDLPNFVLFKFDKKQMKEQYINAYPVLQSDPQNFLQWLAKNIGVTLKTNENLPKTIKESEQQIAKKFQMSSIIYSQNEEYEEMARLYELKREKSKARKESIELFDRQIQKLRQKFKEEPAFEPGVTIQIRFRLPVTGNSLLRNFKINEKVGQMFQYIHCFGRDQFQQRLAEFDLTQTFPKLTLLDKKQQTISQVFSESERQNLIVKQL